MKKVLILNGPNLNLLGTREPGIYGSQTLADVEQTCRDEGARLSLDIDCRQSNHEGQLIDWIHEAGREFAAGTLLGVVFNAGALTHTSIALHDAIKGTNIPVIELHISNVHAREPFRHHSWLSPAAKAVIAGFGVHICGVSLSRPAEAAAAILSGRRGTATATASWSTA